MRKLKRVGWFCFAGCCCAALMLIGGEQSRQTKLNASDSAAYGTQVSVCPNLFAGQLGDVYYFMGYLQGDCNALDGLYLVTDTRMHAVGVCPNCPDPITMPANHPALQKVAQPSPVPQPDPMFSGVLR
jgi:hypothetical protein